MEIEVNSSSLIDSPFDPKASGFFVFDDDQVDDFVNDIKFGLSTCYLVSGYRGVGKTSFIKKVEHLINNPKKSKGDKPPDNKKEIKGHEKEGTSTPENKVLFVYTNFAKHDRHTHLIRKLIRELFLTYRKSKKYDEEKDDEFKIGFELLYQRTFKDITETNEDNLTRVQEFSLKVNPVKTILKVFTLCAPLILFVPWYVALIRVRFGTVLDFINENLIPMGLFVWAIINTLKLRYTFSRKKTIVQNVSTKSLFDDEIAGTLFFDVLKKLKNQNLKVVFVLDELDKVPSSDLDLLVSELKPYLVCGHANFIVVGGQDFYYKFDNDDNIDDAVLSSIFSKVYHIPLSSAAALRRIFDESIISEKNVKDPIVKKQLDDLVNYLIFTSRLVPRRFITRLRQNIIWKEDKAFLTNHKVPSYVSSCEAVIKLIDSIDDNKLSDETSGAIRDYVLMKMYIHAQSVFKLKTKSVSRKTFVYEESES